MMFFSHHSEGIAGTCGTCWFAYDGTNFATFFDTKHVMKHTCSDRWSICFFILYILIFHCKHTHIYIQTTHQLRYPREALQLFAYIPGAIWTI